MKCLKNSLLLPLAILVIGLHSSTAIYGLTPTVTIQVEQKSAQILPAINLRDQKSISIDSARLKLTAYITNYFVTNETLYRYFYDVVFDVHEAFRKRIEPAFGKGKLGMGITAWDETKKAMIPALNSFCVKVYDVAKRINNNDQSVQKLGKDEMKAAGVLLKFVALRAQGDPNSGPRLMSRANEIATWYEKKYNPRKLPDPDAQLKTPSEIAQEMYGKG